jgi:hypothetical protein
MLEGGVAIRGRMAAIEEGFKIGKNFSLYSLRFPQHSAGRCFISLEARGAAMLALVGQVKNAGQLTMGQG